VRQFRFLTDSTNPTTKLPRREDWRESVAASHIDAVWLAMPAKSAVTAGLPAPLRGDCPCSEPPCPVEPRKSGKIAAQCARSSHLLPSLPCPSGGNSGGKTEPGAMAFKARVYLQRPGEFEAKYIGEIDVTPRPVRNGRTVFTHAGKTETGRIDAIDPIGIRLARSRPSTSP
jgi:hypothetical protein